MDLTETFERLFTGKHFTSDAEFEQACEDFKKETGCRFARRHVIYRPTPLEGLPNLLLKQGQFTCSVSYCDAFFAVGSKKSGVYVTRFNMHHIHGPMPEETYNVVCDLSDDFRRFFPVDRYASFDEFHNRLIAFQNHTGSSYVKRHTVRWPPDAVEREHLVYARAHFECVRYGWSEGSSSSRPVVSKRIGCKAYVVIQTYKGYVEIFHLNMQHNHEITHEDAGRQSRRAQPAGPIRSSTGYPYLLSPETEALGSQSSSASSTAAAAVFLQRAPARVAPKSEQFLLEGTTESLSLLPLPSNHRQPPTSSKLEAHLESVRQLGALLLGGQSSSEEVKAMAEELEEMAEQWRSSLEAEEVEDERGRHQQVEGSGVAPILVEFASSAASAPLKSVLR